MNWNLIFAIIFYGFLIIYFLTHRKKFQIEGKILALYKTKIGLKLMKNIAIYFKTPLKFLSYISISISSVIMGGLFIWLIYETIQLVLIPSRPAALAPIIPGVKMPGLPLLPFWYFIVGIFIVAVIHEFSHGVYAKLNHVKVKSSGFAFLGPILAAFVEPDEKQLNKKSSKAQLSIFSAGPFANIALAFLILLLSIFLVAPFNASLMQAQGIQIYNLEKDYPMQAAGFEKGEVILEINNKAINTTEEFISIIKATAPGDRIVITTDKRTVPVITVVHPKGETYGYLGVLISPVKTVIKPAIIEKYGSILPAILFWLIGLLNWIFVLNLGIGLFNLLPLGPIDGGRMLRSLAFWITKKEKKAKSIWKTISLITLVLVLTQIFIFFYRWIF